MRSTRGYIAAILLFSIAGLCPGCGAKRSASEYADAYRRYASLAVKLCAEIEPLRASRLGISSSDSLLFTYSEDEIRGALAKSQRLLKRFSSIPAGRLNGGDTDRATVIIDWLRGVRFAFDGFDSFRWNPFLYCWTAEEALWVMPSRIEPPYSGELEAYRKRILRIPSLFSNAAAHLKDPAEWHARYAIDELDTLAAGLPALAALVRQRYGTSLDGELATVRQSILDFRRFISDTLIPTSHGKFIIGSENLSKIFLYGEHLNVDPNVLIAEGEKQVKRLENEKSSILKRIELEHQGILQARPAAAPLNNESFESRLQRLLGDLGPAGGGSSPFGRVRGVRATSSFPARPEYLSRSLKAPYLSIPPAGDRIAAAVTSLFSAPACQSRLALSAGASRIGDDALRFALLCAAPRMLETDRLRCEAKDTTAVLFSSATFEDGWRYVALLDLGPQIKKDNPELYILVLDDWRAEYARMVVVFSLHAGTMTSDGAIRYLMESLNMSRETAEREVIAASVSPAVAYPAISMIMIEDMLKNISYVFGSGKPHEELTKLLRRSRDIPLSMITPKTQSD
ncbi:MAG TPA: DUF885 family protein [Candidatus Krumholzibacteriaceae bacterium]